MNGANSGHRVHSWKIVEEEEEGEEEELRILSVRSTKRRIIDNNPHRWSKIDRMRGSFQFPWKANTVLTQPWLFSVNESLSKEGCLPFRREIAEGKDGIVRFWPIFIVTLILIKYLIDWRMWNRRCIISNRKV